MGAFVATVNVPGYLPMADEPATFSTATAAWQYLRDERERDLEQRWIETEDATADEQDEALAEIETAIASDTGEGYVWGTGPSPAHDLGLAYSVTYDADAEIEEY